MPSACFSIPATHAHMIVVAQSALKLFYSTPSSHRGENTGFAVTTLSFRSEAFLCGARVARNALGPAIASYLEDPGIVEFMRNPDRHLWIDRLAGLADTGCRVTPPDAERIVRLVAQHVGIEVHAGNPRVLAELPKDGGRFAGLVPPVVAAPSLRRPPITVFHAPLLRQRRNHIRHAGRATARGQAGAPTREHRRLLMESIT